MDSGVCNKTLKDIQKLDNYLKITNEKQNDQFKKMNQDLKKIIKTFNWSKQWIQI